MARTKRGTPPSYRRHSSGQACVTVRLADGRRREIALGPSDSPESKAEYSRVLAELAASQGHLPTSEAAADRLSVNELALACWEFAQSYHRFDERAGTAINIRDAIRLVRQLYGHTPAAEFGPLALKACRAAMVKKDWSRSFINAQADRLRRIFRWGASEQLIPVGVYEALMTIEGLRRGRTEARET
jgi:hypothetical protein